MKLANTPWPAVDPGHTLLVPVGSCEQHGPHLPLDTDTRIANAVAHGTGIPVAPAIPYGSSGEHEAFPGTVSIGTEALRTVLVEYGRSASRWASRLVFVNGHGGNASALVAAVRLLRAEGRELAWFACTSSANVDAHAGRTETALLRHIAPEQVVMSRAEPGNRTPIAELLPQLRAGRLRELSPNGILGDPAGATAAEGAELLAQLVDGLRAAVTRWELDEHGRLR
ncbi:creatinine amidohydrolase [Tamaricihabitans halophyticus]|uniref:Creatinine amidohydrolase n=1 Tax=Tamaricihabitans halophyticus TaxID=1262583 RepID=A0A4R2R417_9PSEU|nr:mycofactocin biosynthesis peptidyl-dipeptidase MftE [Tamaricihabitans halophyticus]TCP54125.1 creatinine amidohydrolase [Tamaricihabitans halophyticus]